MEVPSSLTPRRIYCRSNICVLCARSFVVTEITATGEKIEKTYFKEKLRLTEERIKKIKEILPNFEVAENISNNGICNKCFSKIGRASRMQSDLATLLEDIKCAHDNVQNVLFVIPSPRKFNFEKRLLSSPSINMPSKQQKFPSTSSMKIVNLTNIPPLMAVTTQQPAIAPKPTTSASLSTLSNIFSVPEMIDVKPKQKARRSLGFSQNVGDEKENQASSALEGQVQVTIYYPSGKKTATIKDEAYQLICKALVRGSNIDKLIVDNICSLNPMAVVNGTINIIKKESKQYSKRGSGSILQRKEHPDFFNFRWEHFHDELKKQCPALLSILNSIVSDSDIPPSISSKPYLHVLLTSAIGLHGRSQEMSLVQFMSGFLLTHGGCTQRDIERLSHIGLSVHPMTVQRKLSDWNHILDEKILAIKKSWENGGTLKYQIVGDNWDKNILPSFRTSDRKTVSLHLFNMYAIVDRVVPETLPDPAVSFENDINISTFLPSVNEQQQLMNELCFHLSTSIIENHPQVYQQLTNIYPKHLEHEYSQYAGIKTTQYPLGMFDCNENKTPEVIRLLKTLSESYVPSRNGSIVEAVFFGGDRLTDERIQSAQDAMSNGETPKERLEGFISKIEDFHRLMNFLEAIHKMTYSSQSGGDRCTAYYFRNFLNMRNVKGKVTNSYRAYKLLYYSILDAICVLLFLSHFELNTIEEDIPVNFNEMTNDEKILWINEVSRSILNDYFFEKKADICEDLRQVVENPDHPENYWVSNIQEGRMKCHFCDKSYAYVGSLKSHENKCHNVTIEKSKRKPKEKNKDELQDYILMLFKLVLLHKNLDTGVDMGDGKRVVRSAKYELPLYNKTNKTKYTIGSIHLVALTSGILPADQKERLVCNRFVNIQGGNNNNIALDEYLEMLNRDSKTACTGHQTKESILKHSKEYPHLISFVQHYENITGMRKRKGFHHLPSYKSDVLKILKELIEEDVMSTKPKRALKCKDLSFDRNPFDNAFSGLSTMIHRHKPKTPFHRLRNPML